MTNTVSKPTLAFTPESMRSIKERYRSNGVVSALIEFYEAQVKYSEDLEAQLAEAQMDFLLTADDEVFRAAAAGLGGESIAAMIKRFEDLED